MAADREHPTGGNIRFGWKVGRPFIHDGAGMHDSAIRVSIQEDAAGGVVRADIPAVAHQGGM